MIKVRQAKDKDLDAIINILKEQDLSYSSISFKSFWVAEKEKEKEIAGIINLIEFDDFFFLSSVGVAGKYQHQGIAAEMLNEIFKNKKKDTYLYTVIPDFFKKFGFREVKPEVVLPSKQSFSCSECTPEICATMVRRPNDT